MELKLNQLFDKESLQEVSKLYNTNKCESLNSTIFQYAPKYKCFSRTFSALCHSATHSRTVGTGKSIIKLATSTGIKVPENSALFKQMKAKDTLRRYHQLRKASAKYKQLRYFYRKRRTNKTLFKDSVYSSENVESTSAADHSYGLQVWTDHGHTLPMTRDLGRPLPSVECHGHCWGHKRFCQTTIHTR